MPLSGYIDSVLFLLSPNQISSLLSIDSYLVHRSRSTETSCRTILRTKPVKRAHQIKAEVQLPDLQPLKHGGIQTRARTSSRRSGRWRVENVVEYCLDDELAVCSEIRVWQGGIDAAEEPNEEAELLDYRGARDGRIGRHGEGRVEEVETEDASTRGAV